MVRAPFEAHHKQDPGSLVWTQRDTTLEKVYKAPSLSSCFISSPFMSARLNSRAWSAGLCGAVFVLVTDDALSSDAREARPPRTFPLKASSVAAVVSLMKQQWKKVVRAVDLRVGVSSVARSACVCRMSTSPD